jgi:hypothetical protein
MPSPFPGMNPYLEQEEIWHDFHQSFIPLLREALAPQVRPKYIVKLEEHLYIHELPASQRYLLGRADLAVVPSSSASGSSAPTATLAAPTSTLLPTAVDLERQSYLEIRDRRSRELITVLELLSPTNKKPGPDREQYLAKRRHLLHSPVHLVEIDLLRGGPRLPFEQELPACDYYVLVSRAEERPRAGLWPVRLEERLPVIPVPLRSPDADARLDLQELLHRLYDAAGYEDYLYTGSPQPPLTPEQQAWARQFLPQRPE